MHDRCHRHGTFLKSTLVGSLAINIIWTSILIALFFYDFYFILGGKYQLDFNVPVAIPNEIGPRTAVAIGFLLLTLISISCIFQIANIHNPNIFYGALSIILEFVAFGLLLGLGAKTLTDIATMKAHTAWPSEYNYPSPPDGMLGIIATMLTFVLVLKLINMILHAIWLCYYRDHDDNCEHCGSAVTHVHTTKHSPPVVVRNVE